MPDQQPDRIWNPAEILPRAEQSALQLERLRDTIVRASTVPFYKARFQRQALGVEFIRSLDDLRRFPFTAKSDLHNNYPFGMFAVDKKSLARIHGSSGTTGKPTFVGYTHQDLSNWADLCARFLTAGGLNSGHVVHIAFGFGMFTGGFGLHYGVEKVGAAVIPASSGNTRRQIMLLQDLEPDVLVCTPSYALTIVDAAHQQGIDPRSWNLKYAFLGGEPWTREMRVEIERRLDIVAFNNYGLSEIVGPGVSGECAHRTGMHIQEDHFLVECIDPETLEPVPQGEHGELVFTTLTRQAMPLIRYRTRDISSLTREACACGRTTTRMSRVKGRSDDMLIVRGVNIFPSQIEQALLNTEGLSPHYLIEVSRKATLDSIAVRVELNESGLSKNKPVLRNHILQNIHTTTGLRMEIELVEPGTLERSAGKANRVVDRRNPP